MKIKTHIFVFIIGAALFLSFRAEAQSSLNLDVRDNASLYLDFEFILSHNLALQALQGQKPWSAGQMNYYLSKAQKSLDTFCDENKKANCLQTKDILKYRIEDLVKRLTPYLPHEKKAVALRASSVESSEFYSNTEPVVLPVSNGIGRIDARINPLTQNFSGQHFANGHTQTLEGQLGFQMSRFIFNHAHLRLENLNHRSGDNQYGLVLQDIYTKAVYKNYSLQLGRESLVLGQGEYGGLFLSNEARPLDHLKLSSDRPFLLPSLLKYLGPTHILFFGAYLGEDSFFPHGFLTGYKISFKPSPLLELGLSNMVMMGGEGAPTANFGRTIGDYFGFSGTSESTSNRILGIDSALTLPFLNGTRLYSEIFFDDKSLEDIKKTLLDSTAYTFGFFVPRLTPNGRLQWRMEGTYTSQLIYRHWQFRDGMTLNGKLLGDPLGPDGYRLMSKLYFRESEFWRLDLTSVFEGRDSNVYTINPDRIDITSENPTENRFRHILHSETQILPKLTLDIYLGYEHVMNYNFISGDSQNNYLFGVTGKWTL